jgi:hypothetical protein
MVNIQSRCKFMVISIVEPRLNAEIGYSVAIVGLHLEHIVTLELYREFLGIRRFPSNSRN